MNLRSAQNQGFPPQDFRSQGFYGGIPSRTSISEVVQVPEELGAYVGDPKFQPTLFKVKEQSHINTVTVNRTDKIASSIFIDAPTTQSAIIARQLIEIHFKQHLKLMAAEEKLHRVENDLFQAQGEMASGHMVEFTIDPNLIGLVIGKKGARINEIKTETGVTNIYINNDGIVKVTGTNSSAVQHARELLEIVEHIYKLAETQNDWYAREYNGDSLNDVKEVSGVVRITFVREQGILVITGTKSNVENAKILLDTQIEYIQKQMALRNEADAARERLYELKKQYGMPTGRRPEGERGDRPGTGRGERVTRGEIRGDTKAGRGVRVDGRDRDRDRDPLNTDASDRDQGRDRGSARSRVEDLPRTGIRPLKNSNGGLTVAPSSATAPASATTPAGTDQRALTAPASLHSAPNTVAASAAVNTSMAPTPNPVSSRRRLPPKGLDKDAESVLDQLTPNENGQSVMRNEIDGDHKNEDAYRPLISISSQRKLPPKNNSILPDEEKKSSSERSKTSKKTSERDSSTVTTNAETASALSRNSRQIPIAPAAIEAKTATTVETLDTTKPTAYNKQSAPISSIPEGESLIEKLDKLKVTSAPPQPSDKANNKSSKGATISSSATITTAAATTTTTTTTTIAEATTVNDQSKVVEALERRTRRRPFPGKLFATITAPTTSTGPISSPAPGNTPQESSSEATPSIVPTVFKNVSRPPKAEIPANGGGSDKVKGSKQAMTLREARESRFKE